jgi:hypothetical protein
MTKTRNKILNQRIFKKNIQSFGTFENSNFEFVSDFGFRASNLLIGLISMQNHFLPSFEGTVQKGGD